MVEDLQASLPTQFIQQIFALDSPVLLLRYSATEKVQLHQSECVYMYMQIFLEMREIPSLEFCMHISVTLEFSNVCLPSPQLLSHLVKLYLSFLAIRNIPILEAMYRYACMSINVYMAALQSSAQVYLVYVTQLLPLEIFLPEERFCQFCHLLSLAKFYPWIFCRVLSFIED